MSEHSPGPWTWAADSSSIEAANDAGVVCFVNDHKSHRTVARAGEAFSHADARLIAAAPGLLAALRALAEADGCHLNCCEDDDEWDRARMEARALIARVEGKP